MWRRSGLAIGGLFHVTGLLRAIPALPVGSETKPGGNIEIQLLHWPKARVRSKVRGRTIGFIIVEIVEAFSFSHIIADSPDQPPASCTFSVTEIKSFTPYLRLAMVSKCSCG